MTTCPVCHRRLLSQASPTCNWCGHEIEDEAYQEQAAAGRDTYFTQQAMHDAASLARIEAISPWDSLAVPLDPFTGLPLVAGYIGPRPRPAASRHLPDVPPQSPSMTYGAQTDQSASQETHLPADEAHNEAPHGDRFQYLEL